MKRRLISRSEPACSRCSRCSASPEHAAAGRRRSAKGACRRPDSSRSDVAEPCPTLGDGNVIGVGVDPRTTSTSSSRAGSRAKEIYATRPRLRLTAACRASGGEFDSPVISCARWAVPARATSGPRRTTASRRPQGHVFIGGNGATTAGAEVHADGSSSSSSASRRGRAATTCGVQQVARSRRRRVNEAYVSDGTAITASPSSIWTRARFKRYWARTATSGRHEPRALQSDRARSRSSSATPCTARNRRRTASCTVRPRQRSHPGLPEGRQVCEGSVRREEHARDGAVLGHRLLEGSAQKYSSCGRRNEKVHVFDRLSLTELTSFGERRPPAWTVLRRAQHRTDSRATSTRPKRTAVSVCKSLCTRVSAR